MKVREGNPFRKFRTEQGLSQTELAKRAGVSKHAILRLEQGMYDKPLPSVVDYVNQRTDIPIASLLADYESFQRSIRAQDPKVLGSIGIILANSPRDVHPLVCLRQHVGLNQTQLAKALCISQTVVNNFEAKYINQHTVPLQLRRALLDNGYAPGEVQIFMSHYRLFREAKIEAHPVKLVSNGA